MKPFGKDYAKYYDLFYSDKDYVKECDFLEEIFSKYSSSRPNSILDVGCGTGGHAIILASRGFNVTGIDSSEYMIDLAREKAKNIDFRVMDIRNLHLEKKYNACICMFAVINYLLDYKDIENSLKNLKEHLYKNSLLIFDFWYGPAVLNIKPSQRIKKIKYNGKRIIRFVTPKLDVLKQLNKSKYHCLVIKNGRVVDEFYETHTVRFLFAEELRYLLERNGFKLLRLCPFLDLSNIPSNENWNVTAICKNK